MKKGILPIVLVLFVSLILAVSCEKAKDEIFQVTVKGYVANGGQPVEGAVVLLLNSANIDSGESIDIDKSNINGSITFSDGGYTIIQVEDGTYYLVAIKDENGNKNYDLGTDPIGWYGHLDTITGLVTIPDPVIVSGEDVTGIDIDTMYVE